MDNTQRSQAAASWRSDLKLIGAIGLLYAVIQLITLLRIYALYRLDRIQLDLSEAIRDRVVAWVIGFLFIILIVRTTKFLLTRNWSWVRIVPIHLVFSGLISFIWYFSFIKVAEWFCQGEDCGGPGEEFGYWYLVNLDKLFLLYIITVSITYTYYYVRRDDANRVRQSQMETQLLTARMKMLRSQLHPHFLFNTLNSIASLIDINVERAKIMVADLADLLRQVLDGQDRQQVALEEELSLLQRYVDIEKTRFSDDLTIDWEIDDQLLPYRVPAMLLQPLVENAIHHGFSRDHLLLHITIKVEKNGDRLLLTVQDDGQGFSLSPGEDLFSQGTGLANTRDRLQALYNDDYSFTVLPTHPGVASMVDLPLELHREPDAETQLLANDLTV
ncbi:MAG: histidine kinase [Lewinella sp.]|nr:histidine kinase [Lewinella sp.]